MIHFNRSGFEFDLPTCWADLTLNQFLKLMKSDGKFLSVLEILSGIDRQKWSECEDTQINYFINPNIKFLDTEVDCKDYFVPDFIEIGGKRYPKPKEIFLETFGQKLALDEAVHQAQENGQSEVEIFPFALALYMQPIVTGKPYDADEVDKLIPLVLECKLREAWPLASFFLFNYVKLSNESLKNFLSSQAKSNSKLELIGFKNSDHFRQFSLWRKVTLLGLMKFYSWTMPRYLPSYLQKLKQQDFKTT